MIKLHSNPLYKEVHVRQQKHRPQEKEMPRTSQQGMFWES